MSSLANKAENAANDQDVEFPQVDKAILASSTDFRSMQDPELFLFMG